MKMKQKKIRFFSPQEIEAKTKKVKEAKAEELPTVSISKTGRLAMPLKTIETLGLNTENAQFRVGTEDRKRTLKTLFLIPAEGEAADAFPLAKTGRGYTISLGGILDKHLDYAANEYTFAVKPFPYENTTGYELSLTGQESREKAPSNRGRKRKVVADAGE